ncbi:MAG: response regulator [Phycisphaerales bacterium]|nr:response regulator [Phycisphaerales bacterium]
MTHKTPVPKALVIEDDPMIAEEVKNILNSLDHEYDLVGDQEAARQKIKAGWYDYVLMELAIPTRQGCGLSRIQNGDNLIDQILASIHMRKTPIIVMTAHGTDSPELARHLLKKGVADFVNKPFDDGVLDRAILEVIAKYVHPPATPVSFAPPASTSPPHPSTAINHPHQPFTGGELEFYPDHVELCGVSILTRSKSSQMWTILQALTQRRSDGSYKSWPSNALITLVSGNGGQGSIAGSIRDFRRNATESLGRELGLKVGRDDVIETADAGYRLNAKITLKNPPPIPEVRHGGVRKMEETVSDDPSIQRQSQILAMLSTGERLRVSGIQDKLDCSFTTARREIEVLKNQGKIEFVGPAKTGYWRMSKDI